MMKIFRILKLKWLFLIIFIIGVDQLSKLWITNHFVEGEQICLLPWLNLTLVFNTGISFGILSGLGSWGTLTITTAAGIVTFALFAYLYKTFHSATLWGLSLLIGGAVGNIIDRIYLGKVIDFIDLHIAGYHWPAFNVADAMICIGSAFLLWSQIRIERRENA